MPQRRHSEDPDQAEACDWHLPRDHARGLYSAAIDRVTVIPFSASSM
jgi:hypothetical protein